MAVIRSNFLWGTRIPPSAAESGDNVVPLPASLAETPEQAAQSLVVYTVPAGYRAIIRTMTNTLEYIQGSTSPSSAAWVNGPGGGAICFSWFRFTWATATEQQYRMSELWNGQLVLLEGFQITVAHDSTVSNLNTVGSGHLLPLQ